MTKIAKELIIGSVVIFFTFMIIGQFDTEFNWYMSWYWVSAGLGMAYWSTDVRQLAKNAEYEANAKVPR